MTVAIKYEDLVQKTFCTSAIRSVMMIDDEFIPYSTLIKSLAKGDTIDPSIILSSQRAAALESFFQNQKILCDLDDSASHLEVDRIRKSDLLIIDYHLESQNPKKTIEILSGLKNSPHFNLAVVYTNEPPEVVWKQITASLTTPRNVHKDIESFDNDELIDFWEEKIENDIKTNSGTYSLTRDEYLDYLFNENIPNRLRKDLAQNSNTDIKQYIKNLAKLICDYHVQINQIYQSDKNENSRIYGDINGLKWLQYNNIFICIHNKSSNFEDDPENILNTLISSLVDWKPSYYQLIQSEIQNQIEAESMSFNVIHQNDSFGQAAWLKEILKCTEDDSINGKIKTIYSSLAEDLYFKFSQNQTLSDFIKSIFTSYKEEFKQVSNPESNLEIFCAEQMGITINAETFKDMYHALNMNLSSKNYREKHISTGTVLFDHENKQWYVCVSPACDMVPTQETAPINKRLTPHRMIQVLRLFKVGAEEALENATRSKYIYAYENGERLYFSVTNPETDLPVSDYLVILNYKHKLDERHHDALTFKALGEDIDKVKISLKLKSQLRTGYAERFQNMASHHSGRIGVDFIKGFEPALPEIEVTTEEA
ncbi:response regulator receiver domain [Acinetobacter johnsonii]|uniref:response regulator receiver domain n=1 Tax=Acinetobacter johnsonii TaxID=40214 RepID=UPI001F229DFA|nr:response regulator receiver domain [Acinetobacter johnsonii]UJA02477.1 transcriptional regulator [Acinetobacter johnsonii]